MKPSNQSYFFLLLIYLSPNLLLLESAQYKHDNLDSNVLWYKNLAESGFRMTFAVFSRIKDV